MTYTTSIANTTLPCQAISGNFREVIEFLRAVHGDEAICFQTFDDGAKTKGTKDNSLVGNWHRQADRATMQRLSELNARGAGIYHTVNHTDGFGRTANNITGITALFCDYDACEPKNLEQLPLPSAIVQSKNGKHIYWFLQADQAKEQFTSYQQMLINLTGGDAVVKDLPRVMRLPGFNHMKTPSDPYLVQLLELHTDRRYTLADFPKPEHVVMPKLSKAVTGNAASVAGNMEDLTQKLADYLAIAPKHSLTGAKKQRIMTRAKAKLAEGSRKAGTASDAMLDTGIIATELLTKGIETPETLVDQLFNLAKAQYGTEDKGYAWDELAARTTIIRGLAYGVLRRHNDLMSASSTLIEAISAEAQYVSDIGIDLDVAKVTVINSPIGTGKTTFIKQAIIVGLTHCTNELSCVST